MTDQIVQPLLGGRIHTHRVRFGQIHDRRHTGKPIRALLGLLQFPVLPEDHHGRIAGNMRGRSAQRECDLIRLRHGFHIFAGAPLFECFRMNIGGGADTHDEHRGAHAMETSDLIITIPSLSAAVGSDHRKFNRTPAIRTRVSSQQPPWRDRSSSPGWRNGRCTCSDCVDEREKSKECLPYLAIALTRYPFESCPIGHRHLAVITPNHALSLKFPSGLAHRAPLRSQHIGHELMGEREYIATCTFTMLEQPASNALFGGMEPIAADRNKTFLVKELCVAEQDSRQLRARLDSFP